MLGQPWEVGSFSFPRELEKSHLFWFVETTLEGKFFLKQVSRLVWFTDNGKIQTWPT